MAKAHLGVSRLGWAIACLTGCFCFVATLLLTASPSSDTALLAASKVRDESDLAEALKRTSLKASDRVRGTIDQLTRLDATRVRLTGWAAQIDGSGDPQTIIVFAGGRAFVGKTAGVRSDVSEALRLTTVASRNIAFDLRIDCNSGDSVLAGAITSDGAFGRIRSSQPKTTCP